MTELGRIHRTPAGQNVLVVVGCGKAKVWDRNPGAGAVPACDAYASSLFKLCRRYAIAVAGDRWAILSAKYGFLRPADLIMQYNTAFGKNADAISVAELRAQWRQRFRHVRTVVSLASRAYNERLAAAVAETVRLEMPLAGLNLFQRTAWLSRAAAP